MKYNIIIEAKVDKDTRGIPKKDLQKIDETILGLKDDPRPFGCRKLTEREGYRIKVGNYRVLYTIDDKTKTVVVL